MVKNLTKEDIEWIQSRYPELKISQDGKYIEGDLSFSRGYKGYHISDSYIVRVSLSIESGTILPKVYEMSNKIVEIVKAKAKDMSDLHINPDKSFCLCIPEREEELFENGFTVKEFFINSVEQFLFQISYYDQRGYFPWGEYAHGYLGHLETFAEGKIDIEQLILLLEKYEILMLMNTNRQSLCLCGSGKKLRSCHPLIFKGINKIKQNC